MTIYVSTQHQGKQLNVYLASNKKALKELGFQQIKTFKTESKAIMWINESYLHHEKIYLF